MKTTIYLLTTILFFSSLCFAQVKTGETKTTVNKTTGDTTVTESVTISESEDITPRNNLIVVNPLKFFLFYNLSYFHKFTNTLIIGAGFQMPTPRGLSGYGLNGEVRLYPTGKNMRGFYVAPNISYNSLSSDEGANADIFSAGVLVGWQWFPGDEFAIGLGIGLDHYSLSGNDENNEFGSYDGWAPALRFDIGYVW